MKIRSMFLLATVVALPVVSAVSFNPAYAERSSSQQFERIAQRPQLTPEQREAKHAERAAKFKAALGLSDQQAQAIKAIHESYKPQMQSLRQQAKTMRENGATREEMQSLRTQKKALRSKIHEEIKAELTPDQIQKFDELKAQRKGRRHRNRKGTQGANS